MNYIDRVALAIETEIPAESRPDHDTARLYRLYAVLALSKGIDVSLQDVHNAWSAWMADTDPGHPALVPFEDLSREKQDEDQPYAAAIRNVAQSLIPRSYHS